MLYLDFSKCKTENELQVKTYNEKINKLESLKEIAELKADKFESLIVDLSKDDHYIKQELIDSQRKLVVLEVNEQTLVRRYTASMQVEQVYQREISTLKVYMI
jgi:hypothetical protein